MSGLDGVLRFLEYFICERGLEGAMVEVKIEQLIEAVQSVLQQHGIPRLGAANPSTSSGPACHPVIDLDAVDVDVELPSGTPPPANQTASSDYPFMFHDTSNPPWGYSGNNDGVLTLRSIKYLPRHPILQGILQRAAEGIPESVKYSFNPISGLIEHLQRKNGKIKRLRLRGFNAVKCIAAQARSLTDRKRFFRAIGSGKVENVDRLVRAQLGRKQGIRGLLSTWDDAAKGCMRPRAIPKQTTSNHVAEANNGAADCFPQLVGPQSAKVAENFGACFKGIADSAAFDGTNNFLGVCRQHANKTSLQFNEEKDLEELFRAKEEGKVHFVDFCPASIAALGMLTDETRLYAARPVLISGDCKKESGLEHLHNVLNPTIDGVNKRKHSHISDF
ncbi:hypothetical protein B0H14DRAFT_3437072 [Mycena olivaceomarginata]|nr:hypothetical protein B0H14DRAFT_3437072 [Mycena olivaceomarginata]